MMKEIVDKHSGAILFKKSDEMITLEKLTKRIEELEKKNSDLTKRIKKLENKQKEDS